MIDDVQHFSSPNRSQRARSSFWRRWISSMVVALWLPVASWGQGPPTVPADPQAGPTGQATPGTPTAIPTVRPMTMEVILVMLMVGAALFVVCKSSRRN